MKDFDEFDNLPNRLTLFRIVLVPIVVTFLYLLKENPTSMYGHVAGWIFVLAAITDFFDGYFARKRNIQTTFGSFLDPVADKFLVVSSLILLNDLGRLSALIVVVLVMRELYITSLRLLASNQGFKVPVSLLGKWKTALQMVGTPLLMAYHDWMGIPVALIGKVFLYSAAFLSLFSSFDYSVWVVKSIKKRRKDGPVK